MPLRTARPTRHPVPRANQLQHGNAQVVLRRVDGRSSHGAVHLSSRFDRPCHS